ncbi:Hypothetical predicted protein [Mytilus galloprovincialis]|uniref:Uncharacterized protein n=1 Tax=Mytilus galloprovincialis TaxID=29158 RepID=A0A8B6CRF1_MYTGA|nr:Hypothetical predicted protein [Mytilus galloprovincialis]
MDYPNETLPFILRKKHAHFSLIDWKEENKISGEQLSENEASKLISDIGLSYYLKTKSCNSSNYPYMPSSSGWNNMCGRIQSLPALPSDIHCSLDTTCYNITCCTDILGVGRSLSIALSVDSCRYTVSLQMERLQRNISLMKYEWDFSLVSWFSSYRLPLITAKEIPPQWAITKLREDMGIEQYLIGKLCNMDLIQQPLMKECSNQFQDNPLDEDGVNCVMSSCYGFECCVDTPILNTSVQIAWEFLECRNTIHLHIEKLDKKMKIRSSDFGAGHTFSLLGIFKMWYQINSVEVNNTYVINVNISVCYETDRCELKLRILTDHVADRKVCDYSTGFLDNSFKLDQWINNRHVESKVTNGDVVANQLMVDLGVDDFIESSSQCDINLSPYSEAVNGWNNDCPNDTASVTVLPDNIKCYMSAACNMISCCVYVDIFRRSVFASLEINTCQYILVVYLEHLIYEVHLLNYQWACSVILPIEKLVCQMTKNCQGLQCCVDAEFVIGERNVFTSFEINVCDELDYSIERKKFQRSILTGSRRRRSRSSSSGNSKLNIMNNHSFCNCKLPSFIKVLSLASRFTLLNSSRPGGGCPLMFLLKLIEAS